MIGLFGLGSRARLTVSGIVFNVLVCFLIAGNPAEAVPQSQDNGKMLVPEKSDAARDEVFALVEPSKEPLDIEPGRSRLLRFPRGSAAPHFPMRAVAMSCKWGRRRCWSWEGPWSSQFDRLAGRSSGCAVGDRSSSRAKSSSRRMSVLKCTSLAGHVAFGRGRFEKSVCFVNKK